MKKNKNHITNFIIDKLGSNSGSFVSILTLVSCGFFAGIYYKESQNNIVILELKKNNYIEIVNLKNKIQKIELENNYLKLKLTENEKRQ
ncbi:hypothetical protein QVZ41_13710 [Wenyingzhuangia sp. chi5]|uniref:Lipoprotein n=1 Tax=Wenyingzhuangia gilva TaxID=3057677 RepID=A0ABT8VV97_9FLAO|nr:hypothetical protein [Wenyingzhuangia sp. chi5]MDO3695902.1 hypothetical protein [Wenyingzhuangia sp. chi5]